MAYEDEPYNDPYNPRPVVLDPNRAMSPRESPQLNPYESQVPPGMQVPVQERQQLPTVPPTPENNVPPDPPFFGQAQAMRLQRLQSAKSATIGQIDDGSLHPQEGLLLLQQIEKGLRPLIGQQLQHQQFQLQQQTQLLHQQVAQQEAIGQENKAFQAKGFPQTVATLVDPVEGQTAHFFQKAPGQWEEVMFGRNHQDRQHLMDREAALREKQVEESPADPGEAGFVGAEPPPPNPYLGLPGLQGHARYLRDLEEEAALRRRSARVVSNLPTYDATPEQQVPAEETLQQPQANEEVPQEPAAPPGPPPGMQSGEAYSDPEGPGMQIGQSYQADRPVGPVTVRPGESSDAVASEMGMDLEAGRQQLRDREGATYGPAARASQRAAGIDAPEPGTPRSRSGPQHTSEATLNALYQLAEGTIPQPQGSQPRHVWEERRKQVNQLFELLLRNHEMQVTHRATLDDRASEQRTREGAITARHLMDQQHQLSLQGMRGQRGTVGSEMNPVQITNTYRSILTHLEDAARKASGEPGSPGYQTPANRQEWMLSRQGILAEARRQLHEALNVPLHRPGEPLPPQSIEDERRHVVALEEANHPNKETARANYNQRFARVQQLQREGNLTEAARVGGLPAPATQTPTTGGQASRPAAVATAAATPPSARTPAQQATFLQQQLADLRTLNFGVHERQDLPEARRDTIRQGLVAARDLLTRAGSVAAMTPEERQRYRAAILAAQVPPPATVPQGPGPNTERRIYPAERR